MIVSTMPLPKISIITPTFNSEKTLARTIQSVVDQDYSNLEYHLIDAGSTDDTLAIARSFPRVTSITSEADAGISDAFNKGLARSTGELIGILNSDDFYAPGLLAKVARWYARSDGQTVLHGRIRYYNAGVDRLLGVWPAWAIYLDLPFNHPSYFVPRSVYAKVGGYGLSFHLAMDFDWTLRAMQKLVRFHYVPEVFTHFQIGGQASSNARDCHREVLRAQLAHGLNPLVCRSTFAAKMSINSTKALMPAPAQSEPAASPAAGVVLSILIPIYNAQATLQRTLDSLESIPYHQRRRVELLLVNDGSTDASPAIIGAFVNSLRFPFVRCVDQQNRGLSGARNAGLAVGAAPWVMLLDADDELKIDPVHFVLNHFQATSLIFAAEVKRHGKFLASVRPPKFSPDNYADVLTANSPFFPSGFCFRKEMLVEPFDLAYRVLEDWPCWLLNPRLFDDARSFRHVTGVTIHIHGQNMSAQYALRGQTRVRIAGDLLRRLNQRLTPKQRNNLQMQESAGRLQLGQSVPPAAFLKFPCDLVLYAKLWIYAFFKARLSKLEPYGAASVHRYRGSTKVSPAE